MKNPEKIEVVIPITITFYFNVDILNVALVLYLGSNLKITLTWNM